MKIVTYTEMYFQEFDQLCIDHLGAEPGSLGAPEYKRPYSLQQDWEQNQDSFVIIYPDNYEEESAEWFLENYSLTDSYIKQLYDKGFLPKEYPIFVVVSW